ncbi:MAG: transcription antitermination factor NusB [Betaproteobacteria bacterium]
MTERARAPGGKPKSARRRSRELALQMIYGWLVNPADAETIQREGRLDEDFARADAALFDRIIGGVVAGADPLRARLAVYLDRPVGELSPVEHAILLIAAQELAAHPETPYKVIINEAIDLAKIFGGTDGHKYVNGVLDRLAAELRPGEVKR